MSRNFSDCFTVSEGDKLFDPFTSAYRTDNAKHIAGISLDNILFQDVIQPQANRENYDTEIFKQAKNEGNMKCTI